MYTNWVLTSLVCCSVSLRSHLILSNLEWMWSGTQHRTADKYTYGWWMKWCLLSRTLSILLVCLCVSVCVHIRVRTCVHVCGVCVCMCVHACMHAWLLTNLLFPFFHKVEQVCISGYAGPWNLHKYADVRTTENAHSRTRLKQRTLILCTAIQYSNTWKGSHWLVDKLLILIL